MMLVPDMEHTHALISYIMPKTIDVTGERTDYYIPYMTISTSVLIHSLIALASASNRWPARKPQVEAHRVERWLIELMRDRISDIKKTAESEDEDIFWKLAPMIDEADAELAKRIDEINAFMPRLGERTPYYKGDFPEVWFQDVRPIVESLIMASESMIDLSREFDAMGDPEAGKKCEFDAAYFARLAWQWFSGMVSSNFGHHWLWIDDAKNRAIYLIEQCTRMPMLRIQRRMPED